MIWASSSTDVNWSVSVTAVAFLWHAIVNCLGKKIVKTSFLSCFSSAENQDAESSLVLHKLALLHWHYSQLSVLYYEKNQTCSCCLILNELPRFFGTGLILSTSALAVAKKSDNLQMAIFLTAHRFHGLLCI